MGAVHLEKQDHVGLIRLDRPPANAIDHATGLELQESIRRAGDDAEIGAIVVWGGPKIFAAGADIAAMAEFSPDQIRPVVSALGDALDLLEALPKVSIAAINGYALGGGLELALAADLRYLAEDGIVGQPEIQLGVIPGAGGTQRLGRLAGPGVASDLVYSGRRVGAEEALRLRLVERVLPAGEVLPTAIAHAAAMASGPREALAAAKAAIRASRTLPPAEGLALEKDLFCALFGTRDQREGMRAFLEKRAPRFGA